MQVSIMAVELEAKHEERKNDVVKLLILLFIASLLGIYLIATTVLISKDGVFYIGQAQKFSSDPIGTMKTHPPGYPFLILAAHKFVTLFTNTSSLFIWIYSAQSITLLCRLLGLIPLYFIGKWLVGSKKSFYAMLILILLPHPAKMSCEVVREWPHILFLATGFLFLLWGAGRGKWWTFGLAGLSSGLGYWIRPECAQLVVYGFIWLTMSMFWPRVGKMSRWRSLIALALLFIGFAFPTLPYMKCTQQIISPYVEQAIKSFSSNAVPNQTDVPKDNTDSMNHYVARVISWDIVKALGEVFTEIGENLMWFFMPPFFAGLYYRLRYGAKYEDTFLITIFIVMNLVMMVCRYCYVEIAISKRWCLPLVAFGIFYIPDGLQVIERRLGSKHKVRTFKGKESRLFLTLFLIGIIICLPKLLRPAGADKQGFRTAATWLKNNTGREDIVAVPDRRISFYAEREGLLYRESIPERAKYAVRIVKGENEELDTGGSARKEFSLWVNEKKKARRIVIYKVL
jgi:hypothetical protein